MPDANAPYLRMAQNNAWANQVLAGAILSLPDAAFTAKRPGFFPSLSRTLNHIYEVDLYYVDALEAGGRGRSVYDREDFGTITALAAAQAEVDGRLIAFCESLTAKTLQDLRRTERKDSSCDERVDALLLHLFQHQVHHRGQAHVQLHDAGVEPPQLDDFHLAFGRVPTAQVYFE